MLQAMLKAVALASITALTLLSANGSAQAQSAGLSIYNETPYTMTFQTSTDGLNWETSTVDPNQGIGLYSTASRLTHLVRFERGFGAGVALYRVNRGSYVFRVTTGGYVDLFR